jgi:dolichol-phosphate mannosyltransferase
MNNDDRKDTAISVVIPCYKEKAQILDVLNKIPEYISHIYCIDDGCPDETGKYIEENSNDPRINVIYHSQNMGVGAAMVTGYEAALKDDSEIVVKIDGDGQMDPQIINHFVKPIIEAQADYTKGNRFFRLEDVYTMPVIRLIGNAVLSFMSKLSTGYWHLFDPNNGYTAIHKKALKLIPLNKIHKRYFFESDMLFRLNTLRAVVVDIPMQSKYGNEKSTLDIKTNIFVFTFQHLVKFIKRIFYNYFLRDFHIASLEWILGPSFIIFGTSFGVIKWIESIETNISATAGTVMLAALPAIIGVQLLLSALNYDINMRQTIPLQKIT